MTGTHGVWSFSLFWPFPNPFGTHHGASASNSDVGHCRVPLRILCFFLVPFHFFLFPAVPSMPCPSIFVPIFSLPLMPFPAQFLLSIFYFFFSPISWPFLLLPTRPLSLSILATDVCIFAETFDGISTAITATLPFALSPPSFVLLPAFFLPILLDLLFTRAYSHCHLLTIQSHSDKEWQQFLLFIAMPKS